MNLDVDSRNRAALAETLDQFPVVDAAADSGVQENVIEPTSAELTEDVNHQYEENVVKSKKIIDIVNAEIKKITAEINQLDKTDSDRLEALKTKIEVGKEIISQNDLPFVLARKITYNTREMEQMKRRLKNTDPNNPRYADYSKMIAGYRGLITADIQTVANFIFPNIDSIEPGKTSGWSPQKEADRLDWEKKNLEIRVNLTNLQSNELKTEADPAKRTTIHREMSQTLAEADAIREKIKKLKVLDAVEVDEDLPIAEEIPDTSAHISQPISDDYSRTLEMKPNFTAQNNALSAQDVSVEPIPMFRLPPKKTTWEKITTPFRKLTGLFKKAA